MDVIEQQALDLLSFLQTGESTSDDVFGVPLVIFNFAQIKNLSQRMFIANVCHGLLSDTATATQRSVYYRSLTLDAGLFASQACVNAQVTNMAATLETDSRDLGLFSTSKGLVACADEATRIHFGGSEIRLADHVDGLVISDQIAKATFASCAHAVVVVEKDTVFQHIVSRRDFMDKSRVVLVTAKGFADRSTIDLLVKLYQSLNSAEFVYVGDLDPYGISIFLDYNKKLSKRGCQLVWLGVRTSDVHFVERACGDTVIGLPLRERDFALLRNLRSREDVWALTAEINLLHDRKVKYEVECLHVLGEGYLIKWLADKLNLL